MRRFPLRFAVSRLRPFGGSGAGFVRRPVDGTSTVDPPAAGTPTVDTPPAADPPVDTPTADTPTAGTPTADPPAVDTPPAADDPAAALPELSEGAWQHRAAEFLDTGFAAMVRRLPVLIARALHLAWQASRRDTSLAVGLNLASGVLTTFGLLATRGVFVALFAGGPTAARVRHAVGSMVVVGVTLAVRAGLRIAAGWAQARLEPRVTRLVERGLYDLTSRVELAAFDDAGFADEMERASIRGAQSVPWLVRHTIDLLTAAVGVIGSAAALVVIQPLLVVVLLVATLPEGWASVRAARISYDSMFRRVARRRRLAMLGELMASRETAAELRAYTMRGFLLAEFDRTIAAETAADLLVARRQAMARLIGGSLGGIATVAVYVVLALLLVSGAVPLSAAGTAVLALQSAGPALGQVVYQTNFLYEEGLYFRDYMEFCERARARIGVGRAASTTAPAPAPDGFEEIRVRDVTLRYSDAPTAALDGVTLTIRRGQTVALVGENGSGKSTLARLLANLYQPSAGTVSWDDVGLRDIDPEEFRERITLVTQDYHHWPFTARQNVEIGRHTRADGPEPVHAAARAGGAHDMIMDLPRGYDTLLDRTFRDGHELSGGQWQRVAAARGFYRDAPLLICDEPSAALDARAEHALFQQLRARAGRRTVVLVTHRLANVRHADQIFVLHLGKLVERGRHDELMAAGGRYADLFTLQASGYQASEATEAREVTGAAGADGPAAVQFE